MNMKTITITGAFVSAIAIGALFSPLEPSSATTDSQVDQNKANVETVNMLCPVSNQGQSRMGQYFRGGASDSVAELFSMTVDELREERQSGKSLADIAAEKEVDVEALLASILVAREDQLTKLVEDGVITEEQKQYMLENMKENVQTAIQRTETGPMNGKGKGARFNQGNKHTMDGQGYGSGGPRWRNQ